MPEPIEPAPPALIPIAEAAAILGINPQTAQRQAVAGTLPVTARRVGRLWKVSRAELEAFVGVSA